MQKKIMAGINTFMVSDCAPTVLIIAFKGGRIQFWNILILRGFFDSTWEDLGLDLCQDITKNTLIWHLVDFHRTADLFVLQITNKNCILATFNLTKLLTQSKLDCFILADLGWQYHTVCVLFLRNTDTADPAVWPSSLTLKLSGESRCSFFLMSSDAPAHSL